MTIPSLSIRQAQNTDIPFLKHMLFEACFWNESFVRPDESVFIEIPIFKKLLQAWGRPGDKALIAEMDGVAMGGAWFRLWSTEEHSFGFVDEKSPELGLALVPVYRSQGIGRLLLRALIAEAVQAGHAALSLSVDPENFARSLYESEGFVKIGESGTSWTFLKRLR